MAHFAMPLSLYMSQPIATVSENATLAQVDATLSRLHISCVPVLDDQGQCTGVLSRSDLLRIGRVEAKRTARTGALLHLPNQRAADIVKANPIVVRSDAPVAEAAKLLIKHHIHRVFVSDPEEGNGQLAAVFSTKEILAAIRDKRVATTISEYMVHPVFTIPNSAALSTATDRLASAHVSGLVVVDEDESPIGVFTQIEALEARELPSDTQVEDVMNYAMLCLDVRTPLFRAAGQALATRARRVLAVRDRKVQGILTGIDFARAAAH